MESKIGRKINKNALVLILTVLILPLFPKIFLVPWWLIVFLLILFWLSIKYPKSLWLVGPLLFLLDLWIIDLLDFSFQSMRFSFDWEKIIITNPGYLKLIERYWSEDLWLPFRFRNIFYSPWLLLFSWLNQLFKLWSPIFIINTLGYSGWYLFILGLVEYFKRSKRKWWPLIWVLTVTGASSLGILVDSRGALILALPALIYFMYLGINSKFFDKWWNIWFILMVIDILLK